MLIFLKDNLNCQKVCEKINNFLKKELSNEVDLSDYVLTIGISKIVDEQKTKSLSFQEVES